MALIEQTTAAIEARKQAAAQRLADARREYATIVRRGDVPEPGDGERMADLLGELGYTPHQLASDVRTVTEIAVAEARLAEAQAAYQTSAEAVARLRLEWEQAKDLNRSNLRAMPDWLVADARTKFTSAAEAAQPGAARVDESRRRLSALNANPRLSLA